MLVEREGVLGRLRELAAESRRGGGRLALVSGEAGIGKTAVVAAFVSSLGRETNSFWGACDAVSPPRPFAAIADIAERMGGPLQDALRNADRDRVFEAFLALIRHGPGRSRVIVMDDLHWADEATLDLLRVAGPRLRDAPVLLIGTYRDHEVGPGHPLRLAVGDIAASVVAQIAVPALSAQAVAELAHETLIDPVALHRVTAGNPFFVTEVIAAYGVGIPASVQDAVVARVERLSPAAQRVIRASAVLGPRSDSSLVLALARETPSALEECLARGLLEDDGGGLSFRHEVARRSILETIPGAESSKFHARALELLRALPNGDPARLAHQAVAADDAEAIVEYAPAAGDRASALGAHHEAVEHYARALHHAERLDRAGQAQLLEAHARECALVKDIDSARASQRSALALRQQIGDVAAEAESLRGLSFIDWLAGDGDRALRRAAEAVALLEPLKPTGRMHARAYATLAQRLMVAGQDEGATRYATEALRIAERMGDEATCVHALTTLGVTAVYQGAEFGWQRLEEAVARARAANLSEELTRGLINLVECGLDLWRLDVADQYGAQATEWLADRDLDLYQGLNTGRMAELRFRRGRWDDAERLAQALLSRARTATLIRVRALVVLGRIAARLGRDDPWPTLDEALALVEPSQGQDLILVRTARAEASLLANNEGRARDEASQAISVVGSHLDPAASEAYFWAWKAGAIQETPDLVVEPFLLHMQGRLRESAAAWERLECPYQKALSLADSNDRDDLHQALALFHRLGALPAAEAVARRLRDLGVTQLPRGPRATTRRNPYGLTEREMEVLGMLARSMRNAEIAERLVLSQKTVDHHVAAVLRKLEVHDRGEAAEVARGLGLKYGDPGSSR